MAMQTVARLTRGGNFEIGEADLPDAGDDGILVKVDYCGICGTDLAFVRSGSMREGTVLGHEFSGEVVAAGPKVKAIAAGDRVTVNPMADNIGLGLIPGAFAQYVRVPAPEPGRNVFKLPPSIGPEVGALIEPFAVGLHAVNRAGAQPGDRIVIFGAGPIGICILAALACQGIDGVLVIDPSAERRDFANRFGAKASHDPGSGSARAFAGSHFGERSYPYIDHPVAQADIIFDCAGVQAVLDESLLMLSEGGTLVMVADPHHATLPARLVMLHELRVIGTVGYEDEFETAIDLLDSGATDLSSMVTHRFTLSQLNEAFDMQSDAGRAMKVLVRPNG